MITRKKVKFKASDEPHCVDVYDFDDNYQGKFYLNIIDIIA